MRNAITRHLPQIAILATGAFVAGSTGDTLIQHHVPVMTTMTCLLGLASSAVFVTARYEPGRRTFTCPTPGCDVRVTCTNQAAGDLGYYRALATDHTRHPAVSGMES